MDCLQFEYNDTNAPVLPPDSQLCPQKGVGYPIHYKTANKAREAYKLGMKLPGGKFKKRKYLSGSSYQHIFMEHARIVDVRDYGGLLDLRIRLNDGSISLLKVRDLNLEVDAMIEIKDFSERCDKRSKVRGSAQDHGYMYAFGRFTKESNYVSMKADEMNIRRYTEVSKSVLRKYFKDELEEIMTADRNQGVTPLESMGGEDGISSYCLVSEDLVNAGHYDLDTSVGVSVFNEKVPGTAKDWFFVLPNTVIVGENDEKAVIIKLFDGCTICWDGRKVFHCTGTKEVGEGNHLYGNYWGGKKYK